MAAGFRRQGGDDVGVVEALPQGGHLITVGGTTVDDSRCGYADLVQVWGVLGVKEGGRGGEGERGRGKGLWKAKEVRGWGCAAC